MTMLRTLADRRPGDGFAAAALLRDDREWAVCFACRLRHPLRGSNADGDYADFAERHRPERGCVTARIGPAQMERAVRRAERRRRLRHESLAGFAGNASVTEAFQAEQSLDLTGLGIATSVTAGWCSCWIDNSSSLYLDILFWYEMAAVNTAATSQKAHYLYCPGSFASTELPSNTAGNTVTNSSTTSATLTYLDITASPTGFPQFLVLPYITQNKKIQSGRLFATAFAHGGWCPKFLWLGVVNAAGPTINTTGSKIGYAGMTAVVA